LEIISMARNHFNDVPVRPDYFGPASYYSRRVDVGVRSVAACEAREMVDAAMSLVKRTGGA
jgi:hypothetical protein